MAFDFTLTPEQKQIQLHDLLALMRADREVQDRRKADQAAVDLEATKEPPPQQARRARNVTRCPVCDAGPDQHC
jgi:hypothetical protein